MQDGPEKQISLSLPRVARLGGFAKLVKCHRSIGHRVPGAEAAPVRLEEHHLDGVVGFGIL